MTTDERRAHMLVALKLMREVVDDVLAEAEAAGEEEPDNYEIWLRTGLDYRFIEETRLIQVVRRRRITAQEFRPPSVE